MASFSATSSAQPRRRKHTSTLAVAAFFASTCGFAAHGFQIQPSPSSRTSSSCPAGRVRARPDAGHAGGVLVLSAAPKKDSIDILFDDDYEDDDDEEDYDDDDDDDEQGDVVLYSDDAMNDDEFWGTSSKKSAEKTEKKVSRWDTMNPKIKERIVKEGQDRAIENKKKRESKFDKKQRMYMAYKDLERKSKRRSNIARTVPLNERTPLSSLNPGEERDGVVISLTKFGAYVDVGTDVDGLLHISQISREQFISHPSDVFSPGQQITVRVVRTSPELRKLQLTMLTDEVLKAEDVVLGGTTAAYEDDEEDDGDKIPLDEIEVDDELWGEIKRVTAYGSYVEVGAVVRGFLHFMDHPLFGDVKGATPDTYMTVGDRVRVWALDVDDEQGRVKLTANRPPGLPGPRREVKWV